MISEAMRYQGADFGEAHEFLARKTPAPFWPPSYEVFAHALTEANKGRRSYEPLELAEQIVAKLKKRKQNG